MEEWIDYIQVLIQWMEKDNFKDLQNLKAGLTSLVIIYKKADDLIYPLSS